MAGARRLLAALCSLAALRLPSAAAQLELLTTTEAFDPSTRGQQKYGDPCSTYEQCGFAGSVCLEQLKTCACRDDLPATNHVDKCGKAMGINESCFFNEQCEDGVARTECRAGRCACRYEMVPELAPDGATVCAPQKDTEISTRTFDPAMIGVLVGMALMFVIICVVLRLFSRARWSESENRTIFNTPNPRLMNVSLLRDSKLLHGQDRRGSRVSIRPPSRQASQQELRAHSPTQAPHHPNHQLHRNPSGYTAIITNYLLGQQFRRAIMVQRSRRGSRASSNHSGASVRSAKSPVGGGVPNNHSAAAPMLESVTIETRERKA